VGDLTLAQLGLEIKSELDGVRNGLRTTAQHAVKAGDLLLKAKDKLRGERRGAFGRWCRENFQVSERTLEKYMRLADYIHDAANTTPESDLDVVLKAGLNAALIHFKTGEEVGSRIIRPPRYGRFARWRTLADAERAAAEADAEAENENRAAQNTAPPTGRTLSTWIAGSIVNARKAAALAAMPGDWSGYRGLITDVMIEETERAQKAWTEKLDKLRELYQPPQREAAE
jgi:hypothetical protein